MCQAEFSSCCTWCYFRKSCQGDFNSNVSADFVIRLDFNPLLWLLVGWGCLRHSLPLGVSVATHVKEVNAKCVSRQACALKLMNALLTHLQTSKISESARSRSAVQLVASEDQVLFCFSHMLWVLAITVLTNASSPAVDTHNARLLTADLTCCSCFVSEVRTTAWKHCLESGCSVNWKECDTHCAGCQHGQSEVKRSGCLPQSSQSQPAFNLSTVGKEKTGPSAEFFFFQTQSNGHMDKLYTYLYLFIYPLYPNWTLSYLVLTWQNIAGGQTKTGKETFRWVFLLSSAATLRHAGALQNKPIWFVVSVHGFASI